jgi:hypothetical protein
MTCVRPVYEGRTSLRVGRRVEKVEKLEKLEGVEWAVSEQISSYKRHTPSSSYKLLLH